MSGRAVISNDSVLHDTQCSMCDQYTAPGRRDLRPRGGARLTGPAGLARPGPADLPARPGRSTGPARPGRSTGPARPIYVLIIPARYDSAQSGRPGPERARATAYSSATVPGRELL
jgi:hypothetical protein